MKPLFGNTFDFDGDGKASFEEELYGIHTMQEIYRNKSIQNYDTMYSNGDESLPARVCLSADNSTYPCGIKTFQDMTGVACVKTGKPNGDSIDGYVPSFSAVYYYDGVPKDAFDKYLQYIKSLNMTLVHSDFEYGIYYGYMFIGKNGEAFCIDISLCDDSLTILVSSSQQDSHIQESSSSSSKVKEGKKNKENGSQNRGHENKSTTEYEVLTSIQKIINEKIKNNNDKINSLPEADALLQLTNRESYLKCELGDCKGIFNGKKRKELQEQLEKIAVEIAEAKENQRKASMHILEVSSELQKEAKIVQKCLQESNISSSEVARIKEKYNSEMINLHSRDLRSNGYYYCTFVFDGVCYTDCWKFKYVDQYDEGIDKWVYARKAYTGDVNLTPKELFSDIGTPCIKSVEDGLFYRSDFEVFVFGPYAVYVGNPFEKSHIKIHDGLCEYVEIIYADEVIERSSKLKFVEIEDSNENGSGACESREEQMVELTLPEGKIEITENEYSDNSSLQIVYLNNGLRSIKKSAFSGCSDLKYIAIPSSVVEIESLAFHNCHNLCVCLTDATNYCSNSFESDAVIINTAKENESFNKMVFDAVVNESVEALANLGGCFETGECVAQSYKDAVFWLEKAAAGGNVEAANHIGNIYHDGKGNVGKNLKDAITYYTMAAEGGNHYAQGNLGNMYFNGEGVPLDYSKAAYWFRKSAEASNEIGQYGMGLLYVLGKGVDLDFEKAAMYFRQASDKGHVAAMYNLSVCYLNGVGISKNQSKGLQLMKEAAANGSIDAINCLRQNNISF